MLVTRKQISRRTLLRGLGTAIALPLLDSMTPAFGSVTKQPARLAFIYVPNGIVMKDWKPAVDGAAFELPRILKPLEAHRDRMLVLSGLTHKNGFALGDGPGDHARAAATFLTGVHPKKTAGADIVSGISVDQVAAQRIGGATKFASLELGCEDGRLVGNCDSGYSCAYSNSVSWKTPSTPLPPEVNPRLVFERLFGDAGESPAARAKRRMYNKSILDFVREDTERLTGKLGGADRRKMDEYLSALREIEQRIENAERENREFVPSMDKPDGVPAEFAEHVRLMFDLLTVAFQSGLTRVSTLMIGREGSTRTYREIGVPDPHHPLTHHRNNPEWIEKITQINCFHMQQFAYFIEKLKSTPDGDGTLLDHTMAVYGSGLSDGNRHDHNDLPVVLMGGGNGTLKPGRHVKYGSDTPMTNLHLGLLDRMGVETESLGDSNGELRHLSDLS